MVLATQLIGAGNCDSALVGGCTIPCPMVSCWLHTEGSIFAKDGRCRSYDARASGTVRGSGAGMAVLRRAGDVDEWGVDQQYCLVQGVAMNNDGAHNHRYAAGISPICTYMHLYAPICTYVHLYAPMPTYAHLCAPIYTDVHRGAPMFL